MSENVLFINDDEVRELLSPKDVLTAVEDTFRSLGEGRIRHPKKDPLWLDDTYDNMLLAMPAYLMDEEVAGMKWVSMFSRQKPGYASSFGNLLILNHADTGAPFALVEATAITRMRTGGGHAVIAAKYLAKKDASVLCVCGCGAQGRSSIAGFLEAFDLAEVRAFDFYEPSAEALAEAYGDRVKVTVCKSAAAAVKGSDMILTVTTGKEPVVTADMMEPGMTVLALNAFYDADPKLADGRYRWFLGNAESDEVQIVDDPGLAGAGLSMRNVTGDLGQVVSGKIPGRLTDDEVIVFTHMGMGSLDLACALVAYRRAMEKGIGQTLVFRG